MSPKRCLVFLAVASLFGCGPRTGNVSGRVIYKQQPLPNGVVAFITADGKVFNTGIEAGEFRVRAVPVGTTQVTVQTAANPNLPPPKPQPIPKGLEGMRGDVPAVPIPARYQSPATSGLTYTVVDGDQEFSLELKD